MVSKKFWLEEIVEEILERKADKIIINSGKSISGRVHIGILRELFICDSLRRMLKRKGLNTEFYFILDDYDPAKRFPPYIPKDYDKYIGVPFSDIPSPAGGEESYARYFASELISSLPEFGLNPKIIWTSQLYRKKEMKDIVRTIINRIDEVREILINYVAETLSDEDADEYKRVMGGRYPISVVCSRCGKMQVTVKGKIMPNRILSYDSETDQVTYFCHYCQEEFREKLDEARLKLNWRIDWPAKWLLLNVTCEPAGKDHTVKGGAYDTGLEICRKIFGHAGPVKVGYEWLRFGDVDMKTHKGIVFTPKQYLEIGMPEVLRYIIIRTPASKHISFRPESLPQYVDEYERMERIFFDQDNNVSANEKYESKITYPLTLIKDEVEQPEPRLPFRFAIIFSQLTDIMSWDTIIKKAQEVIKKIFRIQTLPEHILSDIEDTIRRGGKWVSLYAPENYKIKVSDKVDEEAKKSLTESQKEVIRRILNLMREKELSEIELQNSIFNIIKSVENVSVKEGFETIYRVIINKKFGPRLGSFLLALDKEWLLNRLESAIS